MALRDFWTKVQTGASLLSPTVTMIGSAPSDSAYLQKAIQHADLWLTPKTVEGFSEADFEFLSLDDKERLHKAVDGFLAVARQVPSNKPATTKQAQTASRYFQVILELLSRARYPMRIMTS